MYNESSNWYRRENNALVLTLYVQPGAKKNEVAGLHGDALKIRLATAPIQGQANKALLKYLAQLFDVPISHIVLKSGKLSRHKIIEIGDSLIDPHAILR